MTSLDRVADNLRAKLDQLAGRPLAAIAWSDLSDEQKDGYRACVKAMVADQDNIKALMRDRGVQIAD